MKVNKQKEIITYTAAGGVLVNQNDNRVLILIRPSRDEVRLPKGHVETGENPEATALREVKEESGYSDIAVIKPLGEQLVVFQYNGHQIHRKEYYYLMSARSKQQIPRSLEDANQFYPTWVDWDQATSAITFEAECEWLRRARSVMEQK
jgi:8-oxo-dGTP pyrophosphatase MutT (NUDIX family)